MSLYTRTTIEGPTLTTNDIICENITFTNFTWAPVGAYFRIKDNQLQMINVDTGLYHTMIPAVVGGEMTFSYDPTGEV